TRFSRDWSSDVCSSDLTGTTARDEGEAYVLLKNAQILSERANAINEIRIKLTDPDMAPAIARRAEAELGYKAVAWQEANESILEIGRASCRERGALTGR